MSEWSTPNTRKLSQFRNQKFEYKVLCSLDFLLFTLCFVIWEYISNYSIRILIHLQNSFDIQILQGQSYQHLSQLKNILTQN